MNTMIICEPSLEVFFSFWKKIEASWEFWNSFSVLVVCPDTSRGARLMFPKAAIVEVNNVENLRVRLGASHFDDMAILSPWLLQPESFAQSMRCIAQCGPRTLGVAAFLESDLAYIERRKQIHSVGFYEIGTVVAATDGSVRIEDSSVAHWPDGEFSFTSDNAGIFSCNAGHVTLLASRVAFPNEGSRRWTSVLGVPKTDSARGVRGMANGFSLIKTIAPSDPQGVHFLSAKFTWSDTSTGHASLVSCYTGPGDERMYAALLEPLGRGRAKISLWRQLHEWKSIKSVEFESEIEGHQSFVTVRLVTGSDNLQIHVNGTPTIDETDQCLDRTQFSGLRFVGDMIHLSQIEVGQM
ncbi:hypothetical protein [Agrobacterium pusense]|uniref:hypothetical protein n=1 Tax=Agrobacterium pusense TaxID=648995 RepID=UPI003FD04C6F|nr:hypothetical protein [Agrobacterium sp. S2]